MKDKALALQLLTLGVEMLTGKTVKSATVKVTTPQPRMVAPRTVRPTAQPTRDFTCEPDGVLVKVDRPRRENYGSQHAFARDMANYRMLIDQAKKCDNIKTRILEDIPAHVHNNRRDWYEDHECRKPIPTPQFICPFEDEMNDWDEFNSWGW